MEIYTIEWDGPFNIEEFLERTQPRERMSKPGRRERSRRPPYGPRPRNVHDIGLYMFTSASWIARAPAVLRG